MQELDSSVNNYSVDKARLHFKKIIAQLQTCENEDEVKEALIAATHLLFTLNDWDFNAFYPWHKDNK